MTNYKQLKTPRPGTTDGAGWCLRHVRNVYGIASGASTAWEGWLATKHKKTSRTMPNVSVPVWFSWTGTVSGVRKNWGHVVAWVPGRGYLSTPLSGWGQKWYPNIESVETALGASFVGWSLDLNGVSVAEELPETDEELATRVINGEFGNGAERKQKLGARYSAVQAIVNKRMSSPGSTRRTYTVKRGDTLGSIAKRYGTTWSALYAYNRKAVGSNPNVIHAGLVLTLP